MPPSSPADLLVATCSTEAARFAVQRWHYSGVLPSGKLVHYGVWERGQFVGAVVFGRGASVPLATTMRRDYDLGITEWCELVRVALTTHESPTTAVVARALRLLRERNPGLRLVISFADPEEGHLGTIYQAGNWVYTGETQSVRQWWAGGRWRHERSIYGKHRPSMPTRWRAPKHRYLFPLDRGMRRLVEPRRLAFPKPAAEVSA